MSSTSTHSTNTDLQRIPFRQLFDYGRLVLADVRMAVAFTREARADLNLGDEVPGALLDPDDIFWQLSFSLDLFYNHVVAELFVSVGDFPTADATNTRPWPSPRSGSDCRRSFGATVLRHLAIDIREHELISKATPSGLTSPQLPPDWFILRLVSACQAFRDLEGAPDQARSEPDHTRHLPSLPANGNGQAEHAHSFHSVSDIAKIAGLSNTEAEAFRRRVERWRAENTTSSGKDWSEVPDARPRSPKYLYRYGAVKHLIPR